MLFRRAIVLIVFYAVGDSLVEHANPSKNFRYGIVGVRNDALVPIDLRRCTRQQNAAQKQLALRTVYLKKLIFFNLSQNFLRYPQNIANKKHLLRGTNFARLCRLVMRRTYGGRPRQRLQRWRYTGYACKWLSEWCQKIARAHRKMRNGL